MKAYTKDKIKTITKGKKRFFALMVIAALGVCMFSGLKAACDDLRYSADEFYDEQNLFDISVLSTMGLTDNDVKVLSKVGGIEAVEGSYSEDVYTEIDGQTRQATVKVLSEKGINVPYLLEGEMPLRSDEIVVTQGYMIASGKQIGDTIVIEEDMGTDEDADDEEETEDEESDDSSKFELNLEKAYEETEEITLSMDDYQIEAEEEEEEPNFLVTEFTIVGVIIDPTDINSQEGAVSFRSNSTTQYTFFVLPEVVQSDYYTAIYITLAGTDEFMCYTDEYDEAVDEIVSILEEEIKADREQARYAEVTSEAADKVDDIEAEVNEKLAEAEQTILDAKVEIEDGWSDILAGKEQLALGETELAIAERSLEKAQRQLERAERELDAAKTELDAGWSELETGESLITILESALDETEKALDETEATLNEKAAEIPNQYDLQRSVLDIQVELVNDNIAETQTKISDLETEIAELEKEKSNSTEGEWSELSESKLTAKKSRLDALYEQLNTNNERLAAYNASYAELDEQEAQDMKEIEARIAEAMRGREEIAQGREEIAQNKKDLAAGRIQLEKAQAQYDKAKEQMDAGWEEVENGWDELEAAYLVLQASGAALEEGEAQFESGKEQYEAGVSEYQEKQQEALDQIAEARQEIAELKMTEWYITTRTSLSGYANVKTDAHSIESIGNAFPVLFLTVAILISLTTISRMVEEDRGLIGTYKALGFTNGEIRRKYIVYALLACILGGILGDFLGFVALPSVLFTVFKVMYQLQNYVLIFNWFYGIISIILFIIAIVGAAIFSCNAELIQMPAMLMRPKAPKNGSRVLLERFTPLWKRLSFLNKVTVRNLFRYKKRLFMTLFGIAGCTSILLAGFTIKDTVTNLMPLQYENAYLYDVMVVSDDNDKLLNYLDDTNVRSYINPMVSNITIINEDGDEESIPMIVISNEESIRGYINLYDKKGNKVTLEDGMVLSTINVSEILGYEAGDTVTIQTMNLDSVDVEISEIVMNYLGNSIYITENTYEELFGGFEPNAAFVMLNKGAGSHIEYADDMALKDGILTCISIEGFRENFDSVFRVINLVVVIIIVMAAALAFVVLFTLSTTNISERERELATIKVLGFFDREVHLYVNKETVILTSLGILLGMPLGKAFGIWILSCLKMSSIYFADTLFPISYLYAALMTVVFALIVNKITDKSLDRIDPVEALKSIE